MGYNVAVVGATGNVGRELLGILAERSFPADEVVALASRRSQGVDVSYGERTLKVKALEHYDFSGTDICLMSAGAAVSKEYSPRIAAAGAVVIDNSSAWRYDSDVPLIVPEVNADAAAGEQLMPFHLEGTAQDVQHASRDLLRLIETGNFGQHHSELIAADARQHIRFSQARLEPPADLLQ